MQRKMRCQPTEGSMNAIGNVTVAVFARVLFDFAEENRLFREDDTAAYCAIQAARLEVPAGPGAAFPLVRKLLAFNTNGAEDVEVAILSRNDPVTSLRVYTSVRHNGLAIGRAIFTSGAAPHR
ncbi:5'-nucleotidase [Burkholderia sp. Bp8991]|uniref:5'-nucleotidase n=1 Tax=Burkholderia sp. Bp8991 TaxID=2184553 RepID=UPI0021AB2D43|nr:5'-nucleotidase [Burkholderia sp. Bp8991]